ncbi:MAG: hypothetical protein ABWX88_10795 [Pseudoxanthomonas sp.]
MFVYELDIKNWHELWISRAMAVGVVAIWIVLAAFLGLWVWQSVRS